MQVELHTREGLFVTFVEMPERIPAPEPHFPEVIVWGVRIFVLDREAGMYREAVVYTVPLEKF